MSRYTGPLCKKCRGLAFKLLLKGGKCLSPKCPLDRRKKSPGQHGMENKKTSVYAEHLREKQRVKSMYGINETEMRINFRRAEKQKGSTGENFLSILERRIDNVVYRLGFSSTRAQARQLVRHGKVTVNDRKLSIPSYLLKENDIIAVKEKVRQNAEFLKSMEGTKGKPIPEFLELDTTRTKGKMLRLPLKPDLDASINEQLIVEYYSK